MVTSVLRAAVGDARDFTNASTFRAYTGLIPREDSSGDAQRRGRISEAGPSLLRWALYLAADVARKHDPQLAALYQRLMVDRGRRHNQALCAVATNLAVDSTTRERLRVHKRQRGPREPQLTQPTAPRGTTPPSLTHQPSQPIPQTRPTALTKT